MRNPPEQKAEELFQNNYMILMEYGGDCSEEILISLLSIKFAIVNCDEMILENKEFYDYINEDAIAGYWQAVKECLLNR